MKEGPLPKQADKKLLEKGIVVSLIDIQMHLAGIAVIRRTGLEPGAPSCFRCWVKPAHHEVRAPQSIVPSQNNKTRSRLVPRTLVACLDVDWQSCCTSGNHKEEEGRGGGIDTRGAAATKLLPKQKSVNPLESSQSPSGSPLGWQGDPAPGCLWDGRVSQCHGEPGCQSSGQELSACVRWEKRRME
jgi:hypothetical protein